MTSPLNITVLEDRSIVAMEGPDRRKLLQGLMTNDVGKLGPGRALYAGFLTGQGKLSYDVFVVDDGERILIELATAKIDALLAHLTRFKLRAEVTFQEEPTLGVVVAWGGDAAARLELGEEAGAATKVSGLAGIVRGFVDPRLAALGARLFYLRDQPWHAALSECCFTDAALADYTAHRLRLGIADTNEIGNERCYPLEANFERLHGVDFAKGCYLGQELTARMKLKGELRKRVLPVTGSGDLPGAGTAVTANGIEIGTLVSASGTQGLAMLRLDRLADAPPDAIRAENAVLHVHWPQWLQD